MHYAGPVFDCDSHVVERADDMNLHVPERFREQYRIESREVDGCCPWFVGGKQLDGRKDCNRPGGLIPRPGSLKEFMLALASGGEADYEYIPVTPDISTRDGRLSRMDALNIDGSLVFPSEYLAVLGGIQEEKPRLAITHAFNQWFDEAWGFSYRGRLFATPMIFLDDLDRAVKEVEWAIKRGARVIMIPYSPVKGRTPADAYFDPFWSRVNEAGLCVALHLGGPAGAAGLMREWGEPVPRSPLRASAFYFMHAFGEQPLMQMISSLIFHNLFGRYPNIRLLSVENGCEWIPAFLRKMDKSRASTRNGPWAGGPLKERPSEIFRRYCGATPYPEDNVKEVVDRVGDDFLCMGSDWPHPEGVAKPDDFVAQALPGVEHDSLRKIMHDNARRILRLGAEVAA